ncbi:DUF1707 domain-containing protein [Actinoplanes sp. KI2]|uniref:DUF1707 SHOCT-like domain-containing protein n=1 Tax=Actinoplanes sp. KI2 TaxID=2983315 RepID=UPI0021D5B414|nr:DUF1707 domain-containing protein [Actinoplanes sp. KI2]MCU7723251.1 DUF1707 domain-containing protein [Actinoplanes sp. KI2]
MGRADMRAGDGDRKQVADQLKTALDEGRLDLSEYDERIQRTYAAKTYADLDGLLDDLPGTVPVEHAQVQPAAPAPPIGAPTGRPSPTGRQMAHWVGPYAGVILVCTLIWLIQSISAHQLQYFWPVWMLIPLILGVFMQWSGDGGRRRDRRRRR